MKNWGLDVYKRQPDSCTVLLDTYDTLKSGLPNAIRVAKEYLEPNGYRMQGVRIDSCLLYTSFRCGCLCTVSHIR